MVQARGRYDGRTASRWRTASASPLPVTPKVKLALSAPRGPTPGTRKPKRTSRPRPASRVADFFGSPVRSTPRASAVTCTVGVPPARWFTTTPASNLSASRTKRGSAGRASSGRVTSSFASPLP